MRCPLLGRSPAATRLCQNSARELPERDRRRVPAPPRAPRGLDGYFKITERGSTVGREVRGGFVTFFTMAYIVVLNPLILASCKDVDGKYLGGGATPTSPRSRPAPRWSPGS